MSRLATFFSSSRGLVIIPALAALPLAGCDEMTAQTAAPARPVLVATVHYQAQAPDRSFVGTIRPTGLRPHFTERLHDYGVELPPETFDAEMLRLVHGNSRGSDS